MTAPDAARWIEAGWCRIGGAGVSDPLWCCPRCHAATTRPDEHTEWHESGDDRIRNLLRLRSGNVRVV